MTATVARCHFWWNNFFFLLSLSLRFLLLRLYCCCCCCWQQHIHIHAEARARAQKNEVLFFFLFLLLLCSIALCTAPRLPLWVADAAVFFCGTTERQGRERNALVSSLVPWQATIYRFAIYYRPLLSSLLCLSLSLSFFLSTPLICIQTLVRLYLSLRHVSRTLAHMYKWSGWW
jgi:hypothetical protein